MAGIGGAIDVLSFDTATKAFIGSDANVFAGGDVLVLATDDSDLDIISGALGVGVAGIGASVGVMSIEKDTEAFIGDGATVDAEGAGLGVDFVLNGNKIGDGDGFDTVTGHGVIVQAESSEDILHFAVAAGAGVVGVSGAVAVTLVDSDTSASILPNAMINQTGGNAGASVNQSVFVNAANELRGVSFAGAIGAGFVGLAGAVDVGIVRNDTLADVAGGVHIAAAADVGVNGLGIKDLRGFTFSNGGGFVAVDASVSVWSIGEALEKTYEDDDGQIGTATQGDPNDNAKTADADAADQAEDSHTGISGSLDEFEDDGGNPNNSSTKQVGRHHGNGRKYRVIPVAERTSAERRHRCSAGAVRDHRQRRRLRRDRGRRRHPGRRDRGSRI